MKSHDGGQEYLSLHALTAQNTSLEKDRRSLEVQELAPCKGNQRFKNAAGRIHRSPRVKRNAFLLRTD